MSIRTLSELINYLREQPKLNLSDPCIPANQQIIKFPSDSRIIINSKISESSGFLPIDTEASGVIIDTATWKTLCIPAPCISKFYKGEGALTLESPMNQYDCWKIRDGVLTSLYWYNNQWNLGTRNSFNLSGKVWIGQKTYLQIFRECLGAYGLTLKHLDTSYSYCIGFCHPEHHPAETSPAAWCVQAYHVADGKIVRDSNELATIIPGLPVYTKEDMTGINTPEDFLRWDATQSKEDPGYNGFILRPKDLYSGRHYMGKSHRLKNLERYFYNIIRAWPSDQKIKYAALIACRLPEDEAQFLKLFPNYSWVCLNAWAAIHSFTTITHAVFSTGVASENQHANVLAEDLRISNVISPSSNNSHGILEDIILSRLNENNIAQGILSCYSDGV